MTIKEPLSGTRLIRATVEQNDRWKKKAHDAGYRSVSEWIRHTLDDAASGPNTVEVEREGLVIKVFEPDVERQPPYEIDLRRCTNSAELLDTMLRIASKNWCTPRLLFQLILEVDRACRELFGRDAQEIFCPMGKDRKVEWPKTAKA